MTLSWWALRDLFSASQGVQLRSTSRGLSIIVMVIMITIMKNIRNIKHVDDNNYDHFCGPPWIVAKSRNVYQGRDKKKIVPICPRNCGRQISTAELLTTPCFAFLHRRKLYFSSQDNRYFFWVAFFHFLVGAVVYLQRNDHISPHNTICSARRVGNVYLVHSHIFRSYNSLHLASSGWGLPWNTKQISKWYRNNNSHRCCFVKKK